jgi:hypothetical protein
MTSRPARTAVIAASFQEVGEVGTGEAGGGASGDVEVDVGAQALAAAVDAQDLGPLRLVRQRDDDLPVEPAGREQCRVEESGRLVAARTTTASSSKPSISASIWLSVCSRSSLPPAEPAPRVRPIASISSMKMIAGRACGPRRTGRAPVRRRRRRTARRSPTR